MPFPHISHEKIRQKDETLRFYFSTLNILYFIVLNKNKLWYPRAANPAFLVLFGVTLVALT